MDRTLLFWTLALFFGASIGFRAIQSATEGQSIAVTLAAEIALLVVMIGGILVWWRKRGRDGG